MTRLGGRARAQRRLELLVGTHGARLRRVAILADVLVRPGSLRLGSATTSINDAGDVLVVWDQHRTVRAGIVSAGGRRGPVQRLGRERMTRSDMQAALGPGRRAIAAWRTRRTSDRAMDGSTVSLAIAPRGGTFGRVIVVESDPHMPATDPGDKLDLALTGERRGLIAWAGLQDGHPVARAAAMMGDTVRPAQALSPPGAEARYPVLATVPLARGGDRRAAGTSVSA